LHCQLDEVDSFFQDKLVNTVGLANIIWPELLSCPLLWEISCVLSSLVALLSLSCHCLMMANCFQVSVMFLGTPCYLFSLSMTPPMRYSRCQMFLPLVSTTLGILPVRCNGKYIVRKLSEIVIGEYVLTHTLHFSNFYFLFFTKSLSIQPPCITLAAASNAHMFALLLRHSCRWCCRLSLGNYWPAASSLWLQCL
jgi:hypothetical protein